MNTYTDAFTVSAPGRVVLFGELGAAWGLDSIAAAVELRAAAAGDSGDEAGVSIAGDAGLADEARRLLEAVTQALAERGIDAPRGYAFRVSSDIPPGVGLGDLAALAVALATAWLRAANRLAEFSGADLAAIARDALERRAAAPGPADAALCSLGGVRRLRDGQLTEIVGADLSGFVIAYHAEAAARRALPDAASALEKAKACSPSFDLASAALDEVMATLSRLDEEAARVLYAYLRNRDIAAAAAEMLEADLFEKDRLGELVDEDHHLLKDYLALPSTGADEVVQAAKDAGALGARASLHPGLAIAYAPDDPEAAEKAIERAGWTALALEPADGARIDGGGVAPPWA